MLRRRIRRRDPAKRVERRKRLAAWLGLFAGHMFNIRMVGWVAVAVAALAGIILLVKLL